MRGVRFDESGDRTGGQFLTAQLFQEAPIDCHSHSTWRSIRAIFSNDFSDHWFIERHQRLGRTIISSQAMLKAFIRMSRSISTCLSR